jgi:light-regulated signal transduction histidine kinase (bacteriophytochrome)
MIPIYNSENDYLTLGFIQEMFLKKKAGKEQLMRELTQNNKDLKQFSYITSHNQSSLSNLTGLLNLIEDIPLQIQNYRF